MASRIFAIPDDLDWKQAYLAAILEKDRERIAGLIEDAREKLAARHRELLQYESPLSEEAEAINDAFYLLQALQSSLSYRDDLTPC